MYAVLALTTERVLIMLPRHREPIVVGELPPHSVWADSMKLGRDMVGRVKFEVSPSPLDKRGTRFSFKIRNSDRAKRMANALARQR
jgi:hypothetical protein